MRILPKNPTGEVFFASQLRSGEIPESKQPRTTWGVFGLIVTCEECSTSFQLDEARIPATGAQVRCSRCKHAFFLASPTASQTEAVDAIAADAVVDAIPNVPSPVADVSASALREEVQVESEEQDWQFNEEIRVEGDDDVDSDSDFGSSEDFGSDLSVESLSGDFATEDFDSSGLGNSASGAKISVVDSNGTSQIRIENESDETESVRDESNFGSVDDFSSLMEDDDVMPVDLGKDGDSSIASASASAVGDGHYASAGSTDDLGDPESWDLVGEDDFSVARPSRLGGTSSSDMPRNTEETSQGDFAHSAYEDEFAPQSRFREVFAGVGSGVGWAVTLFLAGLVLTFGLRSEWSRGDSISQTISVGELTAQTVGVGWVETSRAGNLFVVSGEVRNAGSQPLIPGILQFAFLDAAGDRLALDPVHAGVTLPEIVIREASPAELTASAITAVQTLQGTTLAPGEVRTFDVIVLGDDMPTEARRILLEMAEPTIPVRSVQFEEESDFSP